jgi:hypothetical protein
MKGQLILIFLTISLVASNPIGGLFNLEDLEDTNYDVVIDQKQNGTQNFRIRVNGLSVALPAEEETDESNPSQEMDLSALLGLQSLSSTSTGQPASLISSSNDLSELAALFDWKKKKSNGLKKLDTQGRTKDIPTDEQLAGDTKHAVKDYAKNANKRYKLLVGEKYIIPLIQFLKRNTEIADDE